MARLTWDANGARVYETGVDRGVLYRIGDGGEYSEAYAWNGLTTISESPEGGEIEDLYADNIKYLSLISAENYKFSIEAYTYPDEFAECDGSAEAADGVFVTQQTRARFGFSYRTRIGNDEDGDAHGYKLHLVYGCLASPSDKEYSSVNDSPEAINFSWEVSSTPVVVNEDFKPTAHIIIDSTKANPTKLTTLENMLYGTAEPNSNGRLPSPATVIATMSGT